jgi:hypothetical protein
MGMFEIVTCGFVVVIIVLIVGCIKIIGRDL